MVEWMGDWGEMEAEERGAERMEGRGRLDKRRGGRVCEWEE